MTNEELAVMIQNGHTELYADLWEQVYRLVCLKAERYSHLLQENGWRMDPEDFISDLIQSGYFALVNAVKYFDPKAGFKFNTFLGNTLKSAFREAVGIRSSKRDALEFSVSLDAPVLDDGDTALMDFIDSRPYDRDDMVKVEDSVYLWELRAALDEALSILTERERNVLVQRFIYDKNYAEQAEAANVSRGYITTVAGDAIEKIRRNRRIMSELAEFMPQYDYDPYKCTGYSSWQHSDISVQERYLLDVVNGSDGAMSFLL